MQLVHINFGDSQAQQLITAARVPLSLEPQTFGLWTIERRAVKSLPDIVQAHLNVGWPSYTLLIRYTHATDKNMHLMDEDGRCPEVVMEDSRMELQRHLPILLAARGRVLVSGLGLGCVVRGLLSKPEVSHIDVVEIDPDIVRIVGAEFAGEPRVSLHNDDALTIPWPPSTRWDFAWHDIVGTEDKHIQVLHAGLFRAYDGKVTKQGAWLFPREFRRLMRGWPHGEQFL